MKRMIILSVILIVAAATTQAATKADKFVPIEWVTIPSGKFMMGSNDAALCDGEECAARPVHEVRIKNFRISKTLVTVEQYAECVRAKKCPEPKADGPDCNWSRPGRDKHPINCINWFEANQYARFVSERQQTQVRLPSEAEWEYAARSSGKDRKYPWGNEKPNCERVVMLEKGKADCGNDSTMPVCSKPKGNTEQGLCDIAGNVSEWLQDNWHDSYDGAPTDGSAWDDATDKMAHRVLRGGSWRSEPKYLRCTYRFNDYHFRRDSGVGFRLVQSNP